MQNATSSELAHLKELSRVLTAEREQQRAVSQIGMRALEDFDFVSIAEHACRVVAETLDCEYCKVLELLPDQSGLRLIAGVGWKEGMLGLAVVPNCALSQAGYTLEQSGPVIVNDLESEQRFSAPEILQDHGVRSGISVIMHGPSGKAYGVLGVHSKSPRAFESHQANFVQQVANVLAGTLGRLEAEREARQHRDLFQTLADNIAQLAWMADESGFIFWFNKRWLEYTGKPMSDSIGWGWQSVHHPEHVERVTEKFKSHMESGEPWEDTFPIRSAEGEYRWFLSRAIPIRGEDGGVVRWFGTNTDITDRRTSEAALEESRRKLQSILDNAPAAVYAKDLDGKFILSNIAHARVLGTTPDEVLGSTDAAFMSNSNWTAEYEANDLQVAETGEPIEVEETVQIDDRERYFLSQKFPLRSLDGSIYGVCGISTDITQRKHDEQHLRMVMAELNHRVKNTLASIQALARVTASNANTIEDFEKSFNHRLVSMGVAHSLLTKSEWRGTSIDAIVESEVRPRLGAVDQLDVSGPLVVLRPKPALALHMAVHEMSTNAAKYGALANSDARLSVRWDIDRSSGELVLEWKEDLDRTLETRELKGFGSQMIRDIVAYELGGAIEFDFRPHGLAATLRFPLDESKVDSAIGDRVYPPKQLPRTPRPADPDSVDAAGTVLLVEDNSTLARYLANHLLESGYRVGGPFERVAPAIEYARRATFDAALLDVDLDGDRVYPVAEVLRESGIPFAFVSGFNVEDFPSAFRGATLFTKPYDLDAIDAWLASAVAASG